MLSEERTNVHKVLRLLREISINPKLLGIPITLSFVSAIFEGVSLGMLIPIMKGFFDKNFSFLWDLPVIGTILPLLPQSVTANDEMLFVVLMVGFLLVYILRNIFRYFSVISVGYFGERSLHHLRKTLFLRYLSFGKLFFDSTSTGRHNTLLLEFAPHALRPVFMVHKFINSLFSLGAYMVVMCYISPELTLYALPLFAVLHFSIRKLVTTIKNLSRPISEQGAELGKKSVEILSSIPLVKAHRTEEREHREYTTISDTKARLDFRVRILQNLILPIQEIITILVACGIFLSALYFLGRDNIGSEEAIITYFYAVLNASNKFGALSNFRGMLAKCTDPLDRVLEVFSPEGKFPVICGKDTFEGISQTLSFKNLTFSYGDRDVLKDITTEIAKGKMTAIVGPTGAGKSTFINLIMRFYDCPPESIFIDGKDIRDFSLNSYLGKIALVSQETYLLHESLRNNITYGIDNVTEEQLQEAVERSRLSSYVSELPEGLETLVGDRGVKLSGGEKQRVSIARALLKGAELLILDEATSSLDSTTEKLIQEAIDEAVKDRTSIVIAHRLSTIQHADNILALEGGKLVESGTMDDLLAQKGLFHELWEQQKF